MFNIEYICLSPKVYRWTAADLMKALEEEALRMGELLKRDLEGTAETWTHKPTFEGPTIVRAGSDISVVVGTNDKNWIRVNDGAKPSSSLVVPRRAKALRFRTGYTAKSRVGSLKSYPGGARGPVIYRRSVVHTGFPGRRFVETAQKKYSGTLPKGVNGVIAVGSRRAFW